MFKFESESATGILVCTMRDFFTVEEVRRYRTELLRHIGEARRRNGYLLMLTDVSDGTLQSAEVAEEFTKRPPIIQHPRDRSAVVVATSLMKMQTKRLLTSDQEAVFTDMSTARAWITQAPDS